MISKSAPGEGMRAARIVAMTATVLLARAETITVCGGASLELEPVQRVGELRLEGRVGRVAGDVLQLEGIGVEVVELGLGRDVLDPLPDGARLAARTVGVDLARRVDRDAAPTLPDQRVGRKLAVPEIVQHAERPLGRSIAT